MTTRFPRASRHRKQHVMPYLYHKAKPPYGVSGTRTILVRTASDDGYSKSDSSFSDTAKFTWTGVDSGNVTADSFFRFANITVPPGAVIRKAHLHYANNTVDAPSQVIQTRLYMNDVDNASVPTDRASHAGKARTTAYAQMNDLKCEENSGSGAGSGCDGYDSADFAEAMQEVVDRAGWASGNAVMVLWDNDGTGNGTDKSVLASTIENTIADFSPEIHIEYTTGVSTFPPFYKAHGPQRDGTGALTLSWPAHEIGDVALLIIESGAAGLGLATASGFVQVADSPQTTDASLSVYWARATSTSMADVVTNAPGNHAVGVIMTFRGCVGSGDPWNVTAGDADTSADTAIDIPGDTTTVDNCLVVAISTTGQDIDSAARFIDSSWANADLANLRERMDNVRTPGNGGGFGVVTGDKESAGSYRTATGALLVTSVQSRLSIALKP